MKKSEDRKMGSIPDILDEFLKLSGRKRIVVLLRYNLTNLGRVNGFVQIQFQWPPPEEPSETKNKTLHRLARTAAA